jgi:hypothetical protein
MPGEILMLPPDFSRPTHEAHNYALMGTWTHKGTTAWEIAEWEGDAAKLKEIFSDSYHMGKWFEQAEPTVFAHIIESNLIYIAKTVELFKPGMILSRIGRVIYCRNAELPTKER